MTKPRDMPGSRRAGAEKRLALGGGKVSARPSRLNGKAESESGQRTDKHTYTHRSAV